MKAEKLKNYRISLGLSQKEFAVKAGVCPATLWKYETNDDCWKEHTKKRIEAALNIKFDNHEEKELCIKNPFERYSTEDLLDELRRRLVG